MQTSNFKLGKLEGIEIIFWENGSKMKEKIYQNGILETEKCWLDDGVQVDCY
jgi:antitoxin component YwqK of YwqJK toxin-antitoxin module